MSGDEYIYFLAELKWQVAEKWNRQRSALADKANISGSYLSEIINDKKTAGFNAQTAIAKACGYQYDEFLALGRKLLAKETPGSQTRDSTANPTKEVPKKDLKVGKNMDVEEWKELLQHYKAMLERNDADMSALRKDNEYLRERVRELETAKRETDVKASEPAKPEKKTAV